MRIVGITDNHTKALATLVGFTILFLGVLFACYRLKLDTEFKNLIGYCFGGAWSALLLALKTDSSSKDPSFRDDVEETPSAPAKE